MKKTVETTKYEYKSDIKIMPDKTIDFFRLFQKVTRMITSTLDVEQVLDVIVQKVPEVIGVDAATIRLLDPAGEKLLLVASCGLSQEYLNRGPIDAEHQYRHLFPLWSPHAARHKNLAFSTNMG